ncbi:TonB system biopolymer transport component [Oleiphilus messinensis]|uniref:TonB system biopolymer transport component n=1 Tax=Oleiphilus messinensis TaxID=141451 RepID=A0A1Y0I912_9GAMM|nr:DUF3450 domain-containing protein [Oleiphilus messinensis]ARU56951.1 TonB system biopolymer transport component [Oleiphilus messinensis]
MFFAPQFMLLGAFCRYLNFWVSGLSLFAICLLTIEGVNAAQQVEKIIESGKSSISKAQSVQKQIEVMDDQRELAFIKYRQLLEEIKGLHTYVNLLQNQVNDQESEIVTLKGAVSDATGIERRIVPLLKEMIDGLDQFITLDIPFLIEERRARIVRLRSMMRSGEMNTAGKLQRVLEAYLQEIEYGRTIESYAGEITVDNKTVSVQFIRFGRLSLAYRTLDGLSVGVWSVPNQQWEKLDPLEYGADIHNAIQVAKKQTAPGLLRMPITREVTEQ